MSDHHPDDDEGIASIVAQTRDEDGFAGSDRRNFTDAARAAALVARRAKAALPKGNGIEVFVVRTETGYSWELRRFGSIVLNRSHDQFSTESEVRDAGVAARAPISPKQ